MEEYIREKEIKFVRGSKVFSENNMKAKSVNLIVTTVRVALISG